MFTEIDLRIICHRYAESLEEYGQQIDDSDIWKVKELLISKAIEERKEAKKDVKTK